MPSRTSCCNGTLFRKDLARFWPIWAAYVIIWFLMLPLTMISQMRQPMAYRDPYFIQDITHNMMEAPAVMMAFFFSIIVAMAVFSYLYQGRSTNFFHALPIRRERQFLSHSAAGLFILISGNVVIFLLSVLVEAAGGQLDIASLLQWLAVTSLCDVAFFGFAAFCAMLTGHILALPCIYVILQFAFVAAEALVQYVLKFFIFGLGSFNSRLTFLSPCVMMMRRLRWHNVYDDAGELLQTSFEGWGAVAAYFLVGAVFLVLALVLYRHRRMEASTDVIAIRVLKPVFRWCLAIAGALCVASILCLTVFEGSTHMSGNLPGVLGIVFLLIGGFIGWVIADILLKKSFRVFRGHWKGFGIFAVIVIVLSLLCQHGAFGYEKRVPLPDEVAGVNLTADGTWDNGTFLTEPENIAAVVALHESILNHKALHTANHLDGTRNVYISYVDADNKVILQRIYQIAADESQCADRGSDLRTAERLLNVQEALRDRCTPDIEVRPDTIMSAYWYYNYEPTTSPSSYRGPGEYTMPAMPEYYSSTMPVDGTLTDEEAYELYTDCILPDMEDGSMGLVWLIQDSDYAKNVLNIMLELELVEPAEDPIYDPYHYDHLHFQIPVSATRTVQWLEAHGYDITTLWDAASLCSNADAFPVY